MLDEFSKCHDYIVKSCICEINCKILSFLIDVFVDLEQVTKNKKNIDFQNYARQSYDMFFGLHTFLVNMEKELEETKKMSYLFLGAKKLAKKKKKLN